VPALFHSAALLAQALSQFAQDEVAWDATDLMLQYFVERHGGMVHAEGEGFSDHDGKILVTVR
jgi:hypothetical protein